MEPLPPEVLELIVRLLDFGDICNLRLVSRDISAKSSHGLVKSQFAAKTVAWTSEEQLRQYVDLTESGWRGCLAQDLTISGVVHANAQADVSADLLGKAFANLRRNAPHGRLKSLRLLVQGETPKGEIVPCAQIEEWQRIWRIAAQTFHIVLKTLVASGLPVKELDVFCSGNRCALACDQLSPILDTKGLAAAMANLTHLSLNLSHHVPPPAGDGSRASSAAAGQQHVDNICRFLRLAQNLETLQLCWHSVPYGGSREAQNAEQGFLAHVAQLELLSNLCELRLQGTYCSEATLLALLKKMTQLRRLSMEEVRITDGKFSGVFDYLTDETTQLEYLFLDDLWEGGQLQFKGPGEPHFPTADNSRRPNDLTWPGKLRQRSISYRVRTAHPRGHPGYSNWARRRVLRYGPPWASNIGYPIRYTC